MRITCDFKCLPVIVKPNSFSKSKNRIILDLRESQSLRFPFNPWTTKMRSRHTSLSEQLEAQGFKLELELPEIISKGIIEPEIEHVEDISPEEENAILGKIENFALMMSVTFLSSWCQTVTNIKIRIN